MMMSARMMMINDDNDTSNDDACDNDCGIISPKIPVKCSEDPWLESKCPFWGKKLKEKRKVYVTIHVKLKHKMHLKLYITHWYYKNKIIHASTFHY